jgi:pyrophosphate--fructose-6-phosphate 1-phosphotransferase
LWIKRLLFLKEHYPKGEVMSPLQKFRLKYQPEIPSSLAHWENLTAIPQKEIPINPQAASYFPHLKEARSFSFKPQANPGNNPLRVGIVFSGGPAAGGHNVIAGVFDAICKWNPESLLVGFLDGPSGIIDNQYRILDKAQIDLVRNQGGFDLLGSGRTKIETEEQFSKSLNTCVTHGLDGLVIIGGDDSNTNAALLAEYFAVREAPCAVVGVPKTIDGDLKNEWVDTSFGFDSASKTYSELIGNILKDASSQRKYYFFIKVMGRTASNLVLECALRTHPHLALISEEVAAKQSSLNEIVKEIADLIEERAKGKKHHGVILIPEGLIEFIPEIKKLISELNSLFAKKGAVDPASLSQEGLKVFQSLPSEIQQQLLLERDPHGNVPVSQIETEKLLISLVKKELKERKSYTGKFSPQPLFFGYEGRSCLPSNFDANYCYALGVTSALAVKSGLTGYMAVLQHLNKPVDQWEALAIPLTAMIDLEERKGDKKPVIKKGLVDLKGAAFADFKSQRSHWRLADDFLVPGPIQFFGPFELTSGGPLSLYTQENSKFGQTPMMS